MASPDGSSFGMPLSMLRHTPFTDFLLPGIILFVANGLCSLAVLAALLFKHKYYPWLVIAQGAVLMGWIVIQVGMIPGVHFLHWLFGGIGFVLVVCGAWLVGVERKCIIDK
jgi:membrane protein YdbS with pleckstrin-like domain